MLWSLGADPTQWVYDKATSKGETIWEFGNQRIVTNLEANPKHLGSNRALNLGDAISPIAGIGMLGFAFVEGYGDSGILGGIRNVALDVALASGQMGLMSKVASTSHSGIQYYYGKFGHGITPGTESSLRKGMRLGGFGFRSVVGGSVGYGVMNAVQGAVGGPIGGILGLGLGSILGNMATAHGGKVGMAGLALGGMYAAGSLMYNASSAVLKAGYNHAQMQKQVNTAGSMDAFSTGGAYTMRSRAVQAINRSHMNARSALGSEASYMHMPSRSYHSPYRR